MEATLENIRDDGAYVFHHPPKFFWRNKTLPSLNWGKFTAYLHVPFCRAICTFCTFEREEFDKKNMQKFSRSLFEEMRLRFDKDDFSKSEIEAVYLGGGTASLLNNETIIRFLNTLRMQYGWSGSGECTLECEPGTKRTADFKTLQEHGVNRISIGVQTFDDQLLRFLNRKHKSKHSKRMIEDAHTSGIENIHVDLIYGLPGQTPKEWRKLINEIKNMGIHHLSAYRLIVFKDEFLHRNLANEKFICLPRTEEIEEMRLIAKEELACCGLDQYSLTEYCKKGKVCKYIKSNWNGSDYLGFGPAAYSRNGKILWENTNSNGRYFTQLKADELQIGRSTELSMKDMMARDISLGLCLINVNVKEIERKTGLTFLEVFPDEYRELGELGLIKYDGVYLTLTELGTRYATHVMKTFTHEFEFDFGMG